MSLDDDPTDEHSSRSHLQFQHYRQQPTDPDTNPTQDKPSTCHPPKPNPVSFPTQRTREPSVGRDDVKESDADVEKVKNEDNIDQAEPSKPKLTRRLSVQDRINLFENKQKESSGSGGKPVVGKPVELRRLSSDVSSSPAVAPEKEKAVLRRWSGVSDMSIDVSGEKKDTESPPCTPSSSFVSQTNLGAKGLNDTVGSDLKSDGTTKDRTGSQTCSGGVAPGKEELVGTSSRTQLTVSSGRLEDFGDANKSKSTTPIGVDNDNLKDQTRGRIQSRSSFGSLEETSLKNSAASQTHFRSLESEKVEQSRFTDQGNFRNSFSGNHRVASDPQIAGLKDGGAHQAQSGAFDIRSAEAHRLVHGDFSDREKDNDLRDDSISQSLRRASTRRTEDSSQSQSSSALRTREASPSLSKGSEDSPFSLQFDSQFSSFAAKSEDCGQQKMKLRRELSAPEQMKIPHGKMEEVKSVHGSIKEIFSGKMVSEVQEDFSSIVAPVQQNQRIRQSKGNQELNDELKLKANELEKLFAEHKLRLPGDQSNSNRRTKPADLPVEPAGNLPYGKQAPEFLPAQLFEKNTVADSVGSSSSGSKLSASSVMKMVDNQEFGGVKQNFPSIDISDDYRGKFYERYMQKRDAKLREEWLSKRAEKEAKLKAMQDSLELSRAEMLAKFSGSADRQNSAFDARRRAERLRSFNTRSTTKREQQQLDFVQSTDDENFSDQDQKYVDHDLSFSETSLGDSASKSTKSRKHLPNRNFSSSTPRTSAAPPVPRSSVKASNSNSGRRRMQSENPLALSVPNFSDLRKENTKPYSGISKTTNRSHLRSYTRSKSTNEEIPVPLVKEEKPRRSQALRKSYADPAEFKDISPLNSEGVVLTPLKFDKGPTEQSHSDKFKRTVPSKPFLRKGNGIGPGSGPGIAKLKASTAAEMRNLDEEYDDLTFEPEDSMDVVKDEEEEEFETMETEDQNDMDDEKSRRSQESDKTVNSGSENGDTIRSFSQVETSLVSELPAAVSSTFHAMGSVQDSPGESPMSWNARMHHPFSYTHETSDVDASVDSPIGSPASWNLHSINQAEAEAARMRKKWGSAQKAVLASNASHNQSRKDVTKGFKRLLKFGRKTRGTDSLADWISATTSEGDDDTEDGRDPANRSSEDLRKSRMGFSQGHPSDDSFNESEFFSEQVQALNSSIPAPPANFKLREDHLSGSAMKAPRSFFSLSTFRSKGSDSKPR